jgi:hypothetical protein
VTAVTGWATPVGESTTTTYTVGDQCFASELTLTGLQPAVGPAEPLCRIVHVRGRDAFLDRLADEHLADGIDYAVTPAGLLLRFAGALDAFIHTHGREVRVRPLTRSSAQVSHLVLDQVLPIRLALLGRSTLHGTAAGDGTRAVAVVGPSGVGKSTLTARLAASGHRLLADDCLLLDARPEWHVVPTYPGTRLRPATVRALGLDGPARAVRAGGRDKRWFDERSALRFDAKPHALALVVLPRRTARRQPRLEPLRPLDALEALSGESYLLPGVAGVLPSVTDAATFTWLLDLVASVPVLRLWVPDDLRRIDAVAGLVSEAMGWSR